MASLRISLPSHVFEGQMAKLLDLLGRGNMADSVILDFAWVKYYIPGAIVAIIARIKKWILSGTRVELVNHEKSDAFRYLQRLDVFKNLGLDLPEDFTRHGSSDFVPVIEISHETVDVSPIATRLAQCITPGDNAREVSQLLSFASSEAMLNCKQHSCASGYVTGQYAARRDFARIAIADFGRGILASFRDNDSPHYYDGMTDLDALKRAIEPEVSSTTHFLPGPYSQGSPNRGIGLSMMRALMGQACGWMFLASGQAWFLQDGNKSPAWGLFSEGQSYPGMICSVAFQRGQVDDYQRMLCDARISLGLQPDDNYNNLFL